MITPILAHEHAIDVVAQTFEGSLIVLRCLCFDQRLVHLADLFGLFRWDNHRIGKAQCFEIFNGCRSEPSKLLLDLPQEQSRGETKILVLDGMLKMTNRRLEPVTVRTEQAQVAEQSRMIKSCFESVL